MNFEEVKMSLKVLKDNNSFQLFQQSLDISDEICQSVYDIMIAKYKQKIKEHNLELSYSISCFHLINLKLAECALASVIHSCKEYPMEIGAKEQIDDYVEYMFSMLKEVHLDMTKDLK